MPSSVVVDGKVLDFKYKKQCSFMYSFYLDTILIGQIFRHERGKNSEWTAVSWDVKSPGLRSVAGFRTRYSASEYLLRLQRYWD